MKPVCRWILMTFELGENFARAGGDFSDAAVVLCHTQHRCFEAKT